MSNKNISQSITEAWAKSVATGMVQSQKKEQKRQQLDETSSALHNKAVQHILENDKGFYRPDTDPFFRKVDGDLLSRQRLAEQEVPMPPEAGPASDKKKKDDLVYDDSGRYGAGGLYKRSDIEAAEAEYKKLIDAGGGEKQTGLYQGETGITMTRDEKEKIDSELAARDKKVEAEVARIIAQRETGINPKSKRYRGREHEAALRGDPDFDPTAPGAQRRLRTAQVRDEYNKGISYPYGHPLSSENTGVFGSIAPRTWGSPGGAGARPGSRREDLTGEDKEAYERTVAARLERDKDKIAAGDMDADGRLTAQGRAKRDAMRARRKARKKGESAREPKEDKTDVKELEVIDKLTPPGMGGVGDLIGDAMVGGVSPSSLKSQPTNDPREDFATMVDQKRQNNRPDNVPFKKAGPDVPAKYIYSDGGQMPMWERIKDSIEAIKPPTTPGGGSGRPSGGNYSF